MSNLATMRIPLSLGGLALAATTVACGPSMSGVAFGRIGRGVEARASSAPQGAEVCALQDALAAANTGSEKPANETCARALTSNRLWRRAMLVLGAYGQTLETVALGNGGDTAGQLDAAETGLRGNDWIDVDGAAEQSAREAATQLVAQMSAPGGKGNLAKVVNEAAPRVKILCEGLVAYLETQEKSLADIERDAEKRHMAKSDRRCALLDTRTVSVSESPVDRMFYATLFGQASLLQDGHEEARAAVAGFCSAHAKLASAAADGRVSSDKTYAEVVEAVGAAHRAQASAGGGKAGKPPKK